jgi:hypothetical protein
LVFELFANRGLLMFCPQAVQWGDVATWVAAIATFAAVVVALLSTKMSLAAVERARAADRAEAAARDHEFAVGLAYVLDHELYMLGGELGVIVRQLQPDAVRAEPQLALKWLKENVPENAIPMTTRFAERLGVFGKVTAAKLLQLIGGQSTMLCVMEPERYVDAPVEIIVSGLESYRNALRLMAHQVAEVRTEIMKWSNEVSPTVANDWLSDIG